MKRDILVKGPHLGGSSDLTLLAPIKPGFIESLDTVTYKSRVRRVLQLLHISRAAAHEYTSARLLSDAIERVGVIHSVRVAVVEPEDKVMLVVTFDGTWESYIRVLWDKVGTLLDLIFCNTVDYVNSTDHTFEEWLAWVRRVQLETSFFYGPPDSTTRDVLYHRRLERMGQRGALSELNQLRTVLPTAEQAAMRLAGLVDESGSQVADAPLVKLPETLEQRLYEVFFNSLQALGGLYRLTEWHRPGTADGEVLRLASIDLLLEFVQLWSGGSPDILAKIEEAKRERFYRHLTWLFPDNMAQPNRRKNLPPPASELGDTVPDSLLSAIQGGILRSYQNLTHGVLLFLEIQPAGGAPDFLEWLRLNVTPGNAQGDFTANWPTCNVAFTPNGLRALGMPEDTVALFPAEFVEGMAARCGLLGDVRMNHPRRWNKPAGSDGGGHQLPVTEPTPATLPIEMEAVHAIVQLRCKAPGVAQGIALSDAAHPLKVFANEFLKACPAVKLLAAQAMASRPVAEGDMAAKEHFGYVDGMGQPNVETSADSALSNRVHYGEFLQGCDNASDKALDAANPLLPEDVKTRLKWLDKGSFLVVRKYRQFAALLVQAVNETASKMKLELGGDEAGHRRVVYAKLMGRYQDGTPLVDYKKDTANNFNYTDDPQGQQCPLHAHVRLAHPRQARQGAARIPRIMRRGMSYFPPTNETVGAPEGDRGVIFMAYNASISEQYEVVQRWLTGGNSTGSSSGQTCPIVGVPENGVARFFPFEYEGKVFRVQLGEPAGLFDQQVAPTKLEWGMYLFSPSIAVLGELKKLAAAQLAHQPLAKVPWELKRGRRLIAELASIQNLQGVAAALARWKTVIEDPDSIDRMDSAAVWAAIREDHAGVLKTAYGTLVANRSLIHEVLQNANNRYSIGGQLARMILSFGEIYLGMDDGDRYKKESAEINQKIEGLAVGANKGTVFALSQGAAAGKINGLVADAERHAREVGKGIFEVGIDAREVLDEVLATLCDTWFGLSDDTGHRFERGGADLAWTEARKPLYPGHFMALSRYMFQPNPGVMVEDLGIKYGKGLVEAMGLFVGDHQTTPKNSSGQAAPIADAIFNHPTLNGDKDWIARTMVGVMMGFIAPIVGAVGNVLREWHRDGTFMAARSELNRKTLLVDAEKALRAPLMQAARMRPMPQIIWRTALTAHRLGHPDGNAVDVDVGDKLVLALVSGGQQSLADGQDDGGLMFGGRRTAGKPHPTHACPGYSAGMEAMLGILSAILSRPEVMRLGPVPLSFTLLGRTAPPAPKPDYSKMVREMTVPARANLALKSKEPKLPGTTPAGGGIAAPLPPLKTRTGLILAAGDSWVAYIGNDLRRSLEAYGYKIPRDCCHWDDWGTIGIVGKRLGEFQGHIAAKIDESPVAPVAVLLSGGGNDSTHEVLRDLLVKNDGKAGSDALNRANLKKHVEKLEGHYVAILAGIRETLASLKKPVDLPVLVHGYDHPYPIGKGSKEWLFDSFKAMGYAIDDIDKPGDLAKSIRAMRDVIDALNDMLKKLADSKEHKPYLRYVNLRGAIATLWPDDPLAGWGNDLHPKRDGFTAMADKIDAAIWKKP